MDIMAHRLTLILLLPAVAALGILFVPRRSAGVAKALATLASLASMGLALALLGEFQAGKTAEHFQFVERVAWVPSFSIHYRVGVDGISVFLVALAALTSFVCVFASWGVEDRGYFSLLLLLQTGLTGFFCAMDFFLLYVFWTGSLVAVYFLIALWGGPRRERAAARFLFCSLAASVLVLLALLALAFSTLDALGRPTFDLDRLAAEGLLRTGAGWKLAFLSLVFGFGVLVPMFPVHAWIGEAHAEAPAPVAAILSAVVLKTGIYGLLRVALPALPEAARWFAPGLAILGAVGVVYGWLCALAQVRGVPRTDPETGETFVERDWRKLFAYATMAHMGLALLGLSSRTAAGYGGATFHLWNHGLVAVALFLLAGALEERARLRSIDAFGGLARAMPGASAVAAVLFLAGMGLPGLAPFVSGLLCLAGAFKAGPLLFRATAALAVTGVALGAGAFLWCYHRIFLGPLNSRWARLTDLGVRERFVLWPLAVLVLALGIFPHFFLSRIEPAVAALLQTMGAR